MTCRAVCISRAEGAGGAEVGRLVSERLGFAYVDEEIVARAATRGGIDPGDVADEESRKSALGRLLREIGRGAAVESIGLGGPGTLPSETTTPDAVRGLVRDAIEEMSGRGAVVIVSHAASHALSGRPEVLRVLVTGSPEVRAKRLSARLDLTEKDARKAIRDSDSARADYLRRFYDVDREQPTHYDLVVNTDVLTLQQAAALVAQAAS